MGAPFPQKGSWVTGVARKVLCEIRHNSSGQYDKDRRLIRSRLRHWPRTFPWRPACSKRFARHTDAFARKKQLFTPSKKTEKDLPSLWEWLGLVWWGTPFRIPSETLARLCKHERICCFQSYVFFFFVILTVKHKGGYNGFRIAARVLGTMHQSQMAIREHRVILANSLKPQCLFLDVAILRFDPKILEFRFNEANTSFQS